MPTSLGPLRQLIMDVQGLQVIGDFREYRFRFDEMADNGARQGFVSPLSLMDRLFRRPAAIGEFEIQDSGMLNLHFWSDPALKLELDLGNESHAFRWEDAVKLIMSAGFKLITRESSDNAKR